MFVFLDCIACTQLIDVVYCYRYCAQHGLYVCVLGTRTCCAKTAKPVKMLCGLLTHVGPRNLGLYGVWIPMGKCSFEGMTSGFLCTLPNNVLTGQLLMLGSPSNRLFYQITLDAVAILSVVTNCEYRW